MKASIFNIISKSISNYAFCMDRNGFSNDEIIHILNTMDYDSIEDRYLADDEGLYQFIRWDKIEKMQAVRIAARNLKTLEYIDFKKHEYKIKEIFFLIKRDYSILFEHFNFDFENLSKDDTYFLLCLGSLEFYKLIDLKKYNFNFIEIINIIRAYNYKKNVILDLNYTELKSYQITEIAIVNGRDVLDIFDLDSLTTLDWLDLLMHQPSLLQFCDLEKFVKGDSFNLVQLIVLFDRPDLSYLLENIDLANITPFGWEKLLIHNPSKFAELCDFSKLNESNWVAINAYSPELIAYK